MNVAASVAAVKHACPPTQAACPFPATLTKARESTRHLFTALVELCDVTAALSDRPVSRELSISLATLGRIAGGKGSTTARRSIRYLERRRLLERIDRGQGRKTRLSVRWSFNGPIPRPAPSATEVLIARWRKAADQTPLGLLRINPSCELNPATGRLYSPTTVRRAIAEAERRGEITGKQVGGGRGRVSLYEFSWKRRTNRTAKPYTSPDRQETPSRTEVDELSTSQLRPSLLNELCTKRDSVENLTAKASPRREPIENDSSLSEQWGEASPRCSTPPPSEDNENPLPVRETDWAKLAEKGQANSLAVVRLVGWLERSDLSRVPTDCERRKLSAGVRLLAPPNVADAVLGALWWRTHAPLRLWRDAIRVLEEGPPDAAQDDLAWWARKLLKRLSAPPPPLPKWSPPTRQEIAEAAAQWDALVAEAEAKERRCLYGDGLDVPGGGSGGS